MITIISPAKIQNFKQEAKQSKHSQPRFMDEASLLIELMRNLSQTELSKLLGVNSQLTQLNFDRIFNWHLPFTPDNAKQAAFVFDGEAFRGLNAQTLSEDSLDYAQTHLRILSGLYGVLRPLDLIQTYRLEVSSKLENPNGKNLYAFWRERITKSIFEDLEAAGEPKLLLNLASAEYLKSLDLKNSNIKLIDVEFYEYKNDRLKQIVVYTKKARGLMARFVIENKIEDVEDLKGFAEEGYWYSPQMSSENKLVFVR